MSDRTCSECDSTCEAGASNWMCPGCDNVVEPVEAYAQGRIAYERQCSIKDNPWKGTMAESTWVDGFKECANGVPFVSHPSAVTVGELREIMNAARKAYRHASSDRFAEGVVLVENPYPLQPIQNAAWITGCRIDDEHCQAEGRQLIQAILEHGRPNHE